MTHLPQAVHRTALTSSEVRRHLDKSRATLARHRASGTYDAAAAHRLLCNNARHACKVHGVRPAAWLVDAVARLLAQ